MTPKEKAKELFDKFYLTKDERGLCRLNEFIAKQCALIAVDEMKCEINRFASNDYRLERLDYLIEVKKEIEKL